MQHQGGPPPSTSHASLPTTCKQEAMNQYPIFAQPATIHPGFSSIPPQRHNINNSTVSFVNGEPWIPTANNVSLVASLSSTIGNLQLSTPPTTRHSQQRYHSFPLPPPSLTSSLLHTFTSSLSPLPSPHPYSPSLTLILTSLSSHCPLLF
jgi:hypothetical protein